MSSPSATNASGGTAVIVVNVVFTFLAIVAVAGRFHARHLTGRRPGVDDYLIVAGLFFTLCTIAVGISMVVDGGAGLQQNDASISQIQFLLKSFVPAPLLWSCATTCVKLSILCFYISIFDWPGFRLSTYVVMVFAFALWVVVVLEAFLLCRPFAYTWDRTIPNGTCGSTVQAYLSVAIVNLLVDMTIVALPVPVLWRLQMSWKKKLAISGILALGLIVCVVTALRIKAVLDLDPLNFTYTVVPDLIYGGLEVELGTINACLPVMQPVFKKHFGVDGVFSRLLSRNTSNHPGQDSQESSKRPQWPKKQTDSTDVLYPITLTSFADANGDDLDTGSLHDPTKIKVRQHFHISDSNV